MRLLSKILTASLAISLGLTSCEKDQTDPSGGPGTTDGPYLNIKFKFDPSLPRLGSDGQLAALPTGNAGLSPSVNGMTLEYLEMSLSVTTPLGDGELFYQGNETNNGGDKAIDFTKATISGDGETVLRIPFSDITPGSYNWVRASIGYQNFNVPFRVAGTDYTATVASFIGYNTYINNYMVGGETMNINGNKLQGFYGVKAQGNATPAFEGQVAAGATTVPNPLAAISPIPQGSSIVTGEFPQYFKVSGQETEDVDLILYISTNKSFEFSDPNGNGIWEPSSGENIVNMGVRGLFPELE